MNNDPSNVCAVDLRDYRGMCGHVFRDVLKSMRGVCVASFALFLELTVSEPAGAE